MGIKQQVRPYAPRPEVKQTDYGAQFVKAATETKDEGTVVLDTTETEGTEPVVKPEQTAAVAEEEKPKKKKGGRPKKK